MADYFQITESQTLSEVKFYDVYMTPKLRSGATISGTPTVTHTEPDGSSGNDASVGTVSGGTVPVKFDTPEKTGIHKLILTVVTSDGETLISRIDIPVVYW